MPSRCVRPQRELMLHQTTDPACAPQAFGRIAYWQKCVPGGDGSATLNGDETQSYSGGTYLFVDANGFLVERSIEWCKLEISEDGLKLAIILPVGLVMSVGVVSGIAQVIAKRAEKKRLAEVAALERADHQKIPELTRGKSLLLDAEAGHGMARGKPRADDDGPVEVDAAQG